MKTDFPRVCTRFVRFVTADRGQSMTEYALICALMAFGATAGYKSLADGVSEVFNHFSVVLSSTFGGSGAGSGGQTGGSQSSGASGQAAH